MLAGFENPQQTISLPAGSFFFIFFIKFDS
jgi:hypothetical protein